VERRLILWADKELETLSPEKGSEQDEKADSHNGRVGYGVRLLDLRPGLFKSAGRSGWSRGADLHGSDNVNESGWR
jgi:hypothetical protein